MFAVNLSEFKLAIYFFELMVNMKNYVSPTVLRRVSVQMETPILSGSVVNQMNNNIETAGQTSTNLRDTDLNLSGFSHSWEN